MSTGTHGGLGMCAAADVGGVYRFDWWSAPPFGVVRLAPPLGVVRPVPVSPASILRFVGLATAGRIEQAKSGEKPGGRRYPSAVAGPRILVIDNYDSFVYNLVQY